MHYEIRRIPARRPVWGTGGREFKSRRSDHQNQTLSRAPNSTKRQPAATRPRRRSRYGWRSRWKASSAGLSDPHPSGGARLTWINAVDRATCHRLLSNLGTGRFFDARGRSPKRAQN